MRRTRLLASSAALALVVIGSAPVANAQDDCKGLPTYAQLKAALSQATMDETSGLNNHMWGTIVDRDGVVCAVAFSGTDRGAQWPGSREISAQKATRTELGS